MRYYEKGAAPFNQRPVTVQIGDDVGMAIYGTSSSPNLGYCVESNFGDLDVGAPGQPLSPDTRPVEVVTSGIGLDNEVWALVRVPPSTASIEVSLSKGNAKALLLRDGFAVLSFTNDRVGPMRRWPESGSLIFKLGTVTGFNRIGFATGSDVISICSAGPAFCGGDLELRPLH
jgi:hypothetical protein